MSVEQMTTKTQGELESNRKGLLLSMKSKVSVVVPIYNVASYINKCIESLLSQSYTNIEIILVDDGSPDNCPQICDDYEKMDDRVKIIHKENGGLSDARNTGLEAATGEYIAFIDGDDYVAPDFIEVLHKICVEEGADVSCCSYYKVYEGGMVKQSKRTTRKNFSGIEAVRDIFTANSLCEVMTCNKLYKRRLFIDNGIRFPVGMTHEDNFTTYKLFYYAHKVSFINNPLYYYIQRDDSIMGRDFNSKRFDIFQMFIESQEFFSQKNIDFSREMGSMRLLYSMWLYRDYLFSNNKNSHYRNRLRAELKIIPNIFNNPVITLKHKILYGVIMISPWLYVRLMVSHRKEGPRL